MMSFDTHAAMDMITHSTGGFSYDTLARALISNKKAKAGGCLLKDCQEFCEYLESRELSNVMPRVIGMKMFIMSILHIN